MGRPAGRVGGIYDRVFCWGAREKFLDQSDVRRALGEIHTTYRLNELFNWQVLSTDSDSGDVADASVTKVLQTADLMEWLDMQIKRSLVITFGGEVSEVMRELIATAGLDLARVPR